MKKVFSMLEAATKRLFSGRRTLYAIAAASLALVATSAVGFTALAQTAGNNAKGVPNIVLVHGTWADGTSWSPIIERLQKAGYNVTAVQLPLTSLAEDTARTRQVLAMQTGPTLLVAHSYGGAVISNLGKDAPNVVGLVYIAALAPDQSETAQQLLGAGPTSPALATMHPRLGGLPVPQ